VGILQANGFPPKDIEWIRGRWEGAEIKRRYLADLEAHGEAPPRGEGLSDIERELRQDLGDNGYDAMLYATHQSNRVMLMRVRDGSIAHRAGLRDGTVLWSYDGLRVFDSKELAALSTPGKPGELIEIVIITDGGAESLTVERNPLGADLVSAKQLPDPNQPN
jgi:S1-C subfamily serine protease